MVKINVPTMSQLYLRISKEKYFMHLTFHFICRCLTLGWDPRHHIVSLFSLVCVHDPCVLVWLKPIWPPAASESTHKTSKTVCFNSIQYLLIFPHYWLWCRYITYLYILYIIFPCVMLAVITRAFVKVCWSPAPSLNWKVCKSDCRYHWQFLLNA